MKKRVRSKIDVRAKEFHAGSHQNGNNNGKRESWGGGGREETAERWRGSMDCPHSKEKRNVAQGDSLPKIRIYAKKKMVKTGEAQP